MSISAMDGSGHLLVEFVLTRHSLVGDSGRRVDLSISGGFELDPGTLPGVVEEFQGLEQAAGSSRRP
jgi:hypothetical protein